MNILFVTPSYKPAYIYGGPTVSVSELAEALVRIGHEVTVYTTTANGKKELDVVSNKQVLINGVRVIYFKRQTGDHTHISVGLWWRLKKRGSGFDIVHLHSWWSVLILGAAWICKRRGVRFILSPRGMLGQYSFSHQHSTAKKYLHRLIGKNLLRAGVLHATTAMEWNDCALVYPNWEGFILHNLVQLPEETSSREASSASDDFIIGFLSRIDPKKGLELLFKALAEVSFTFKVRIGGTGELAYVQNLKSYARKLGISDNIEWCGWKSGNDKFDFLKELDLFVLPSYNENFAIVVPEALFAGTAVLVTDKVGLADYVAEKGLGFVCQTTVASIRKNLELAYQSEEVLRRIRQQAPQIIRDDFDPHALAARYITAYKTMEGGVQLEAL